MDASGARQEVVYEYTPEPPTAARPVAGGAKGGVAGTASRSVASVSASAHRGESEAIDSSAVNVQDALNLFAKKEAAAAEAAAEAAAVQAASGVGSGPPRAWKQGQAEASGPSSTGAASAEPLEQRCVRLQVEVAELLRIAEGGASTEAAELLGVDPASMAEELRVLEQRLRALRRTGDGGGGGRGAGVQPPGLGGQAAFLVDRLDRLSNTAALASVGTDANGRMTWELNYAPSTSAIADGSKVAALESSLADMAKKLGAVDSIGPYADLQGAVVQLHRRLALLDSQRLEAIRSGAAKMMTGLDTVVKQKSELPSGCFDSDVDKRVCELYDVCHRWNRVASGLPAVVTRMQSLQSLHQLNASFNTRLAALEHQQDELTKLLDVTSAAVNEMGRGMLENMAIMQENVQNLERKLLNARR